MNWNKVNVIWHKLWFYYFLWRIKVKKTDNNCQKSIRPFFWTSIGFKILWALTLKNISIFKSFSKTSKKKTFHVYVYVFVYLFTYTSSITVLSLSSLLVIWWVTIGQPTRKGEFRQKWTPSFIHPHIMTFLIWQNKEKNTFVER